MQGKPSGSGLQGRQATGDALARCAYLYGARNQEYETTRQCNPRLVPRCAIEPELAQARESVEPDVMPSWMTGGRCGGRTGPGFRLTPGPVATVPWIGSPSCCRPRLPLLVALTPPADSEPDREPISGSPVCGLAVGPSLSAWEPVIFKEAERQSMVPRILVGTFGAEPGQFHDAAAGDHVGLGMKHFAVHEVLEGLDRLVIPGIIRGGREGWFRQSFGNAGMPA